MVFISHELQDIGNQEQQYVAMQSQTCSFLFSCWDLLCFGCLYGAYWELARIGICSEVVWPLYHEKLCITLVNLAFVQVLFETATVFSPSGSVLLNARSFLLHTMQVAYKLV